jgi:hypothetical protein
MCLVVVIRMVLHGVWRMSYENCFFLFYVYQHLAQWSTFICVTPRSIHIVLKWWYFVLLIILRCLVWRDELHIPNCYLFSYLFNQTFLWCARQSFPTIICNSVWEMDYIGFAFCQITIFFTNDMYWSEYNTVNKICLKKKHCNLQEASVRFKLRIWKSKKRTSSICDHLWENPAKVIFFRCQYLLIYIMCRIFCAKGITVSQIVCEFLVLHFWLTCAPMSSLSVHR